MTSESEAQTLNLLRKKLEALDDAIEKHSNLWQMVITDILKDLKTLL